MAKIFSFLILIVFLAVAFLPPQIASAETRSLLMARTAKLESERRTLYFTAQADLDRAEFEKVHAQFNHAVEIISVALVNQRDEIARIIVPPPALIFPFILEENLFLQINTSNSQLLEYWKKDIYAKEDKEAYFLRFMMNCLENPLGEIRIVYQNNLLLVEARIQDDFILLPLDFIKIPPAELFETSSLNDFFVSSNWKSWDENRLIEEMKTVLKAGSQKKLQIRKSWFLLTTDSQSKITESFQRWVKLWQSREPGFAYSFIVHSHIFPMWDRLKGLKKRPDWSEQIDFALLPSLPDWEYTLESLMPFQGIYVFNREDNSSHWAYYPISTDMYLYMSVITRSLQPIFERELTLEEYLRGKSAFEAILKRKAQVVSLGHSFKPDSAAQNQFHKNKFLRSCRRYERKNPRWTQDFLKKLNQVQPSSKWNKAADSWELFLCEYPWPEPIKEKMFYIANRLRYQQSGEKEFSIHAPLLEKLRSAMRRQNQFSSTEELFLEIQNTLFTYLD